MTNCYKQIQLTNNTVGAVDVEAYIPYGNITRRINAPVDCCNTFSLTSSTSDTLTLNDKGFYKVTYSLNAAVAAEGDVSVALVVNNTNTYQVSQYAAAADSLVNLTLPYTIRVTTAPVTIQMQNVGLALTSGSSNFIVEKI